MVKYRRRKQIERVIVIAALVTVCLVLVGFHVSSGRQRQKLVEMIADVPRSPTRSPTDSPTHRPTDMPTPPMSPRLFCGIPFKVREHAQEKMEAIMSTWADDCDGIGFFVDRGDKELFEKKFHNNIFEIDMVRKSGEGKGIDNRPSKHILER